MSAAFLLLLPQLISAGVATATEVRALIAGLHPGLSDAEMDAVLGLLISKAQAHLAQAQADLAEH